VVLKYMWSLYQPMLLVELPGLTATICMPWCLQRTQLQRNAKAATGVQPRTYQDERYSYVAIAKCVDCCCHMSVATVGSLAPCLPAAASCACTSALLLLLAVVVQRCLRLPACLPVPAQGAQACGS
jgi:hypothetical protein